MLKSQGTAAISLGRKARARWLTAGVCCLLFLGAYQWVEKGSYEAVASSPEENAVRGRALIGASRENLLADAWGDRWPVAQRAGLESGAFSDVWLREKPSVTELLPWAEAFPIVRDTLFEALVPEHEVEFLTSLRRSSFDASGPYFDDALYNPSGYQFARDQRESLANLEVDSLRAITPLAEEAALLFREALTEVLRKNQFDRWLDEKSARPYLVDSPNLPVRGACRRTFRGIGGGWQILATVDSGSFPELDVVVRRP